MEEKEKRNARKTLDLPALLELGEVLCQFSRSKGIFRERPPVKRALIPWKKRGEEGRLSAAS